MSAEKGQSSSETGKELQAAKLVPLLITLAVGVIIWFIPPPQGIQELENGATAWHLLAIFVATIVGLIVKPLPMGAVAMIGIALTTLTGTLSITNALSGFGNSTIWLIALAFFISRGFIKTGLGARIAYLFMRVLGKRSLGLGYGLIATDLVLAPAIPSNTARAGGVVFPILQAVSKAYGSNPDDGTARKIGSFLTYTAFQGTVITSAMFLTAMAANPLAVQFAADAGIDVTWGDWAIAALVPGLISLLVIPYLIYRLYPPEIKATPKAAEIAREQLSEMGAVKTSEWIMLGVFVLLLIMWIFGKSLNIHSTAAALVGLGLLLLTGVLTWQDVLQEKGAWDTLVWFAALVMMAAQLNSLGLIPWFSESVGGLVAGIDWLPAFLILSLVYFYSHYLFASNTAHVSAMYAAFLGVAIAVGTPALLAALVLAFFSNLFSSMTHYGTGPAPVFFGSGYVELSPWWRYGLLISVVNIAIWLVAGGLWWKILGYW
ncbi:MAG: anion permease [Anaerolineae bacterium]|nr:anion permease [Anaerolineae bacterium]